MLFAILERKCFQIEDIFANKMENLFFCFHEKVSLTGGISGELWSNDILLTNVERTSVDNLTCGCKTV